MELGDVSACALKQSEMTRIWLTGLDLSRTWILWCLILFACVDRQSEGIEAPIVVRVDHRLVVVEVKGLRLEVLDARILYRIST